MTQHSLGLLRRTFRSEGIDNVDGWSSDLEHLHRCTSVRTNVRDCPDCQLHVYTPAVKRLVDLITDIKTLTEQPPTLAWVVATAELQRAVTEIDIGDHHDPGIRAAAGTLADLATRLVNHLRRAAIDSLNEGGTLTPTLRRQALLLAVPASAALPDQSALPSDARQMLKRLEALASPRRIAELVVQHTDIEARSGFPPLITQPEWKSLPCAGPPPAAPYSHSHSLESLVAESVADDVLHLTEMTASALACSAGAVAIRRPTPATALSSRTRELVWRRARINWPLSVLDTALPTTWSVGQHASTLDVEVPSGMAHGLQTDIAGVTVASALHT